MKFLFSIFVVFNLLLRPVLPFLDYAVNYKFISNHLCENKNRPEMMCNGKCYLVKELSKNSENIPEQCDFNINICCVLEVVIPDNFFVFTSLNHKKENQKAYIYSSFNYTSVFFNEIFHPPLV